MSIIREITNNVSARATKFTREVVGVHSNIVHSYTTFQVSDGAGGYEDFQVGNGEGGHEDFEVRE